MSDDKIKGWLLFSFIILILSWFLTGFTATFGLIALLFAFLMSVSSIVTFILSIVCIPKYENKAFPIIALVISALPMLAFIIGLIIGLIADTI